MNTEQLLLNKWQNLDADEQAKVLAFIDAISQDKYLSGSSEKTENVYQPKTELGKKLWEIRQRIISKPNIKLLDWDGIEA